MYIIYNILYGLALLCILPYQYFKRPKGLRSRWLRERSGFISSSTKHTQRPIWIHAVSVGEVIASVPLLKGLKKEYPYREIVLSTVTDTGQKVAGERVGDLARIIYVPFDIPFAVAAAFRKIRPSLFIIMETELWPVLIRFSRRHGIPVLLMNGRLSDKSVRGYMKLRFFFGKVLSGISFFCMQNEEYAQRVISLGADEKSVLAIGSFKFDTRPAVPVPEWTRILNGPVLIAGSTHRTEEDIVLDAFGRLLTDNPSLNLIVVPRHPERFREVEELVKKKGLKYLKRSEMKDGPEARKLGSPEGKDIQTSELTNSRYSGIVVILDVMGELASVYGAADIAVMGGSFIDRGGQNPLEPAFWGKAIVCGPHMENFPFIDEFYQNGAAVKTGADKLYNTLNNMLSCPESMSRMGQAAKALYEKNAGATGRALKIIEKYI